MNKLPSLLILGAGQYGTVVKEIAVSTRRFGRIAFLDDAFDPKKSLTPGDPLCIGKLEDLQRVLSDYPYAVVAIGNPQVRKQWTQRLLETGFEVPAMISPHAFVGRTATVQSGAIVEPMAVVHENASVGTGCLISAGAVVNHNATVSDYCHVDSNAVVARGAFVPSGVKVPSGTVFTPEHESNPFQQKIHSQNKNSDEVGNQ